MDIDDVTLDEDLESLWRQLKRLHRLLRNYTHERYGRVNPFVENLFDWKEKGEFFGGKNVTIYDSTTIVGDVKIGDHTWIGPFCSLDGPGGLTIGSYCSISLGCQLLTHDTVKWALTGGKEDYEYAPTKVGNNCFLGTFAVVLKGVTIGDRCVIGAGAAVTKDVPDNYIVAGVPARSVGRVRFDNKGKARLEYEM